MVCDFSDNSLTDMKKKLLEAKEILRFLNDEYFLDRVVEGHPYGDGSMLLRKAADFLDDIILQSES